jgi:hypothetical protein
LNTGFYLGWDTTFRKRLPSRSRKSWRAFCLDKPATRRLATPGRSDGIGVRRFSQYPTAHRSDFAAKGANKSRSSYRHGMGPLGSCSTTLNSTSMRSINLISVACGDGVKLHEANEQASADGTAKCIVTGCHLAASAIAVHVLTRWPFVVFQPCPGAPTMRARPWRRRVPRAGRASPG